MPLLFVLLAILALPAAEIYVMYKVGEAIGYFNMFALLMVSTFLGSWIARSQGVKVWQNVQSTFASGQMPAFKLVQGLMVLIGGVLMVIPGFITSAFGLLFILPGTRHLMALMSVFFIARQMRLGRFVVAGNAFSTAFGGKSGRSSGRGPRDASDSDNQGFGAGQRGSSADGFASAQGSNSTNAESASSDIIDVTPISSSTDRNPSKD